MTSTRLVLFGAISLALFAPACGGGTTTNDDAGTGGDVGARDGGGLDTGAGDSGGRDTGAADTGGSDTGAADTGASDTGAADTGAADTGPVDAGPSCAVNNGGCDPLVTCMAAPGGVVCGDCPAGYTGTGATACTDIDECTATANGGCDLMTMCVNTPGSRTCTPCPMGFSGTGETACTDIDECTAGTSGCDPLVMCTNTPGSFTCGSCPTGYTGGGASGCVDIDECMTVTNGGCDALTTCTNTPGGRTCSACPSGYTGTGETACVDIDECATNHGGCDANATCTNTPGGRTCACNACYTGDGVTCSSGAAVFTNDSSTLARFEFNCDYGDESGNGRAGTAYGPLAFVPTPHGQGVSITGYPQGLDWSAYAGLLTHPFTVEIALVPTTTDCYRKLFGFDEGDDNGWYYCSNGFQAYPNGVQGAGMMAANTYQYLALVSTSATTMDVYFNGALVGSTDMSFTSPPTQALFFRDDNGGGERFDGVVDAMRISSTSRSAADVAAQWALLNPSAQILLHCDSTSPVLSAFSGYGCHSPIAAGGASYALLGPNTPSVTLWTGANCTGCSLTIGSDTNFCDVGFAGCGGANDNVQSISFP